MDKPKIIEVKTNEAPTVHEEVPAEREAPQHPAETHSQPRSESEEDKKPASHEDESAQEKQLPEQPLQNQMPPTSPDEEAGLSDLEKSVLTEMKKRGELSEDEARQIIEKINPRKREPAPQAPAPEARPVEEASEKSKPRIVKQEEHSHAKPQTKPLIRQERVGGEVTSEHSTLDEELRRQATRDILPLRGGPRAVMDERARAAETAQKIWEQKQREKSWFYKVKKLFGLTLSDET